MRKLSRKILSVLAIASIITTTSALNASESFADSKSPSLTKWKNSSSNKSYR